jgi:hypothetical protein
VLYPDSARLMGHGGPPVIVAAETAGPPHL